MRTTDPSWDDWIAVNLRSGCDLSDMQARMVAAGWGEAEAIAALADVIAQVFPALAGAPAQVLLPALPESGITPCDGRNIRTVLRLAEPAIALCEDVLSQAECTNLLRLAESRGLLPSTVVDEASGAAIPHPERTSAGVMFRRAETPLIARIEQRLASLTQWPLANGEGLQILRYRKGQEYRPHFDSFPEGAGGGLHTARGGQRVNTVLVYLKSPSQGGGTCFPEAGLTLCPPPGSAVIFRNVDAAGRRAPTSLHSGLPVIEGEKVVLTYWQRVGTFS